MKANANSATGAQGNKNVVVTPQATGKAEEKKNPTLLLLTPEEIKEVTPPAPTKEEKPVSAKPIQQPAPRPLTIDELTEKAERLYKLKQNHEDIKERRRTLEAFTISHDKDNAQLTLVDAKGLEITTSTRRV